MNEKIEKIKKQFDDQSSTVDNIRRLLSDNMKIIQANIEELRSVRSVNMPESAVPADGFGP